MDLFEQMFPGLLKEAGAFDAHSAEFIPAMRRGKLTYASPKEVDYEIMSPSHLYTEASNLSPMGSTMAGARLFMGSKYVNQALPLKDPEAALVQVLDDDTGKPLEQVIGSKVGLVKSPVHGTIKRVDKENVLIAGADGKEHNVELRNFYSHNRKTQTTDTPLVKEGDVVKPGQSLAHSNYVMPDGTLALSKNLRVAFMPGKGGGTFEDAITVSEGAAKKLTSNHMIGFDVDHKGGVVSDKSKFMQLFPNRYTKDQLDKIGENGMARKGVTLQTGDPIFLSLSPRVLRAEDRAKGNLHKILKKSFSDKSQTWEKSVPGVVADAVETRHGLSANISADFPLSQADKISSRAAAKGVIGSIVPDHKMFRDSDGNPIDILINPAALIGRKNPMMVFEAMLGKIAHKTGQKYVMPSFSTDSFHKFVSGELKKHGVSDTEDLFDPETGKKIPNVLTGIQAFYKLEHTADTKWSAIDEGGVDQNFQPTKPGGTSSAKRIGNLDVTALLSHGAVKNLYDIQNYRTGGDPDLWRAIRMGHPLPAPKVPFVYDKFINTLKGAGINTERKGSKIFIKALKAKDIDELVGQREVKNSETIDPSSGQPIPGGLMDQSLHGIDGKRWSYINLGEPVPNPILEEPLRKILGLTESEMRDILSNKGQINGNTGPKALIDALGSLDLDKEEQDLRSKIRNGSSTTRNSAVQKLNIISGIKKQGIGKEDFFMTKVPVLPAAYRPISMAGRMMLSADSNYLYKDLMTARDLHEKSKQDFGDQEAGNERLAVYDSLAAVMGLGDPLHPKLVQKGVKGFIRQLAGSGGPKTGSLLGKVIGHTVGTVGRGAIIPSDELDMDQIGVPEKMAWKMYSPFVMRRLVKHGMPSSQAALNVERKTDYAKRFLLEEMKARPVMYSRAPSLHRFNIMGAEPQIVTGDSIRISPLVVKPFTADFDGDEQVGKVLILRSLQKKCTNSKNHLTHPSLLCGSEDMFKDITLPHYNPTTHEVSVVDLEDFPRGEFTNRNENGKNGPIDFFSVPEDIMVLALDEKTNKPVWAQVAFYSKHYQRKIEIVNLLAGRQIITDDDPRAVYGMDPSRPEDGLIRCTPTEALNRKICVPYSPHAGAAVSQLPEISEITITDREDCIFKKLPLTRELGYLLGALCGDGWWDKKDYEYYHKRTDMFGSRNINMADLKGYNALSIKKILTDLFLKSGPLYHYSIETLKANNPSRYGDTVKHTFNFKHSELFAEFLSTHLGGEGDENTAGSGNKHLSGFMYQAPREFREGLLCGLVDTDGSCSVSHAKEKPQLLCAFSSTSLRLVRDVKFLASTLGINSTITWSKTTTAGNDSWILAFSSVDCKRHNIFVNLECPWKKEAFLTTPVRDDSPVLGKYDTVFIPHSLAKEFSRQLGSPQITSDLKKIGGAALEETLDKKAVYRNIWGGIARGAVSRNSAYRAIDQIRETYRRDGAIIEIALEVANKCRDSGKLDMKSAQQIRAGIVRVAPAGTPNYKLVKNVYSGLDRPIKTGKLPESTADRIIKFLAETERPQCYVDTPEFLEWSERFLENKSINWSPVDSVEKTGVLEDGYDLTVPGYETFMAADGVILSNTMNVHVPVSDDAVKEIKDRLMPSQNLLSIKGRDAHYTPSQEFVLGLYNTTAVDHKKPKTKFKSAEDVIAAYRRGDLNIDSQVDIG